MNLKVGMTVKLVNLPENNPWNNISCKVTNIGGEVARIEPLGGKGPEEFGMLHKRSWDKHLKIINMSMVNK